jgi:RHS repeat-associated protein
MKPNDFMIKQKKQRTHWRLPMRRNSFRPILAGTIYGMCSVLPFGFEAEGRVKSSTDAYGNVTTYEYDNLDRQVAVQSKGLRNETIYNAKGQVEKTISNIKIKSDGTFDYSESITTVNTYNPFGQVIKTVTDGRIVEYEYDDLGRQIATIDHPIIINGQEVRHRSETVYDELGRVVISRTNVKQLANGTIDRTNAQELKYVYDYRGNVIKTIVADGTEISATYNEQGQKISETNQLGLTRTFEYNTKGQLIAVVLPSAIDPQTGKSANPRYEYQYDDFGRQILISDPNGHETEFGYDAFGNQITRTLPLGFGADGILGTADDVILPEGDFTERSEYDSNRRVVKQISFEGIITTFTYDDQGRVKSKTFYENQVKYFTNSPSQTWTYSYDSQGRITSINQNGRKTETNYDSQGRTISIKTPEGTVSYEYDKFGRQIRVSSNKGDDIRYSYDLFGRLETVTNGANGDITKYEYDLVGNLSRTITKNSTATLITTYEYDNMNRLVKETNFNDKNDNKVMDEGEGISQFAYELDKQGKKINATENFWVDLDTDGTLDLLANYVNWKYDNAGRLIREVFDHYDDNFDQTSEWIYDLVGNRLKQTINGKETQYNYDANDRLLREVTNNKMTVYGYDHTQQTSKTVSESGEIVSTTTYEYDLQGRMSVVTIISGNKTEITKYEYSADGIRVSAEHEIYVEGELQSKIRTEYLNDSKSLTGYSQVLRQTEYDTEGNIIKETSYVIGHQRISQTVEIGGEKTTHYFTFDGHGSVRVLLDAAMAVAQIYSFDAYGNALGFDSAEALTEFLYSGEQFDSKIGQQYLRARYYDPATGRFNRLDPFFGNLDNPQSLHKYLYTHAEPVNGIDPSGEFLAATIGITCVISAGIRGTFDARSIGFFTAFTSNLLVASNGIAVGVGLVIDGMALLYRYGSPYLVKEYAQIMIAYQREHYVKNVQKCIVDMFNKESPTLLPNIQLTHADYENVGRIVGEAYCDKVWQFLEEHPFVTAQAGYRLPWETERSNPYCEDWAIAISEMFSSIGTKTLHLQSGQIVHFDKLLRCELGQWNDSANTSDTPSPLQHNFAVLYPQGYTVSLPVDPVLLIFDPWQTLLPNVYTTQTFNMSVDRVGDIIFYGG